MALIATALLDTVTFYLMVDAYGVSAEANPIVSHLFGIAPMLPALLKLGAVVLIMSLPGYRVAVAGIASLLWGFGAITNVMTMM